MKYMFLKNKHFVVIITIMLFQGCRRSPPELSTISGKLLPIDRTISPKDRIANFIAPYQLRIDQVLDSVLTYSPTNISKTDGAYNSSAGNLMADIILQEVNPIFKARTGNNIDFVLLNFGGIRSTISKGTVSARNAFEVMPFENAVDIVELDGKTTRELVTFLIRSKLAHPIAGIQIIMDREGGLHEVNIQGKPFDEDKKYYVATSDYLVTGGDRMDFFKNNISVTRSDYKIKNVMIDYFKKVDTLHARVDDRFIHMD